MCNRTKSPGRQTIPTPRELAMQANAISAEGYKWEKYRLIYFFEIAFVFVYDILKPFSNICLIIILKPKKKTNVQMFGRKRTQRFGKATH